MLLEKSGEKREISKRKRSAKERSEEARTRLDQRRKTTFLHESLQVSTQTSSQQFENIARNHRGLFLAEKKKMDLEAKFRELKKSGKLEKYMQKKRKKNASKEKRKLPNK